ncbi:MAG TPA: alpha/beta fold hydrolase [Candidatus Nanoarchaeia archaeon]|nr:alpha/beta fold hydrolase [Candidatus Nanoarchaeia archaeon]
MEKITLQTSDNLKIVGNHFKVPKPNPGISLFHMMPASKESYSLFAEQLNKAGIGVLSIDLRGHGESAGGNYQNFTDEQHQSSIHDVEAAVSFQEQEGHSPLFVGGASIGANLALQIIVEDKLVKKAILLSPGLNYRGIETVPLAKTVAKDKEVYIVTAKDDLRSGGANDQQAQVIFNQLKCKKKIKIFEAGGHGTDIFKTHPELMDELVKWLKN